MPLKELNEVLDQFEGVEDVVWAQEEPRNMGPYGFMLMNWEASRTFRSATRRPYGAPAAGSSVRSKRRHQEVIDYVFDKTIDNQRK